MSGSIRFKRKSLYQNISEANKNTISIPHESKKRRINESVREHNYLDFNRGVYETFSDKQLSANENVDDPSKKLYDQDFALSPKADNFNSYIRSLANRYNPGIPIGQNNVAQPQSFNDIIKQNPTIYGLQHAMESDLNPVPDDARVNKNIYSTIKNMDTIKSDKTKSLEPDKEIPYVRSEFKNVDQSLIKGVKSRIADEEFIKAMRQLQQFTTGQKNHLDEVSEKVLHDKYKQDEDLLKEQTQSLLATTAVANVEENEPTAIVRPEITEQPSLSRFKSLFNNVTNYFSSTPSKEQNENIGDEAVENDKDESETDENEGINAHLRPLPFTNFDNTEEKDDGAAAAILTPGNSFLGDSTTAFENINAAISSLGSEEKYLNDLIQACNGDRGYLDFVDWLLTKDETCQILMKDSLLTINGPRVEIYYNNAITHESMIDFIQRMTDATKAYVDIEFIYSGGLERFDSIYGSRISSDVDPSTYKFCKYLVAHFNSERKNYKGLKPIKIRHTTIDNPTITLLRLEKNHRSAFVTSVFEHFDDIKDEKMSAQESPYAPLFEGLENLRSKYKSYYDRIVSLTLFRIFLSNEKYKYKKDVLKCLIDTNLNSKYKLFDWDEKALDISPSQFMKDVLLDTWYNHGRIPPIKTKIRKLVYRNSELQTAHLYNTFSSSPHLSELVAFQGLLHALYSFTKRDNLLLDQLINEAWQEYSENLQTTNLLSNNASFNNIEKLLPQIKIIIDEYTGINVNSKEYIAVNKREQEKEEKESEERLDSFRELPMDYAINASKLIKTKPPIRRSNRTRRPPIRYDGLG